MIINDDMQYTQFFLDQDSIPEFIPTGVKDTFALAQNGTLVKESKGFEMP